MNNKIDNEYDEDNYWGNINLVINSNIDKDKVNINKNSEKEKEKEKEKIKNRNLEIKSDNKLTNELFTPTNNDLVKNKKKY